MISRFKANSRRGFTLVELLVVMGIIGILAAVLFPAFTSLLAHARMTKCAANLRNIGAAMITYAGDNNGNLPLSGGTIPWGTVDTSSGGTGKAGWCEQLGPYIGVNGNPYQPTLTAAAGVFQCPDNKLVTNNAYYSYFNGAHAAYSNSGSFSAVNLMKIKAPSAHIIAGDIAFSTFSIDDADKDDYSQDPAFNGAVAAPVGKPPIPIHGGRSNIVFADGHVENAQYYDNTRMTTHYAGIEPTETYLKNDQ